MTPPRRRCSARCSSSTPRTSSGSSCWPTSQRGVAVTRKRRNGCRACFPPLEVTPPTGDIETFDGTLDFNAVAHDAAKAEGLEVQEEVAIKPQELEVEGLAATQYESGRFAARADATPEPEPDMPTVDLPLIMPEDVAPRSPSPPQLPAWPTPLAPPELAAPVPP